MCDSEQTFEPVGASATGKVLAAFLLGAGLTAAAWLLVRRAQAATGVTGVLDRCDKAAHELENRLNGAGLAIAG